MSALNTSEVGVVPGISGVIEVGEVCALNNPNIVQAVGDCAVLSYLATHDRMNEDQLILAQALLTGPDHEFARSEVLPPLKDGDKESALGQRFAWVARTLIDAPKLEGVLKPLHEGRARTYVLDKQLMSERCGELKELMEGTPVVIKPSKFNSTPLTDSGTTNEAGKNESSQESDDECSKGWQDYGNCRGVDPDLFFPERGASTREAKEVCKGCVVREPCLDYALANGEKFGIWGGLSERERRRIRRQRALARRTALDPEID